MKHLEAAIKAIENARNEIEQANQALLPNIERYHLTEALWTVQQAIKAIQRDEERKKQEDAACTAVTTKQSQ